jgi:hypothetical protein
MLFFWICGLCVSLVIYFVYLSWLNHPVRLHLKTLNMMALSKFENYPAWGSPDCNKFQFVSMLNTFVFNHRNSPSFPDVKRFGLEHIPTKFVSDNDIPCAEVFRTLAKPYAILVALWPLKCNAVKMSKFWRAFVTKQDEKNPGCSQYSVWAYNSVRPPIHTKIWDLCEPDVPVYIAGHSVMSEVALIFAHHSIVYANIQPSRITVFASGCLPTFTPTVWKTILSGAKILEILNTCDLFANRVVPKMIRGPRQYLFTDNCDRHGRVNIQDCHKNAVYISNIVHNFGEFVDCKYPY